MSRVFVLFFVPHKTTLVYEPASTDLTNMGSLSSVNSIVYHQVGISQITLSTFSTIQWLPHPMDLCIVAKQAFFDLEVDVTRVAFSS